MWAAYQEILKSHPDVFGTDHKKFFYDCGINFYSVNKLFDREEGEKEFRINLVINSCGNDYSLFSKGRAVMMGIN